MNGDILARVQWSDELDAEYSKRVRALAPLGRYVEDTLFELLEEAGLVPHSITHRVKTQRSTAAKYTRADKSYTTLTQLHDLLGLRVITYFPDDVDRVAPVIEEEFDVLPDESVDRRASLDPDRFGYVSSHYVVRLGPDRLNLREKARYRGLTFEIQVRSILQHAWAEIEHDLGYKSRAATPRTVRRRFARLAGLLEIADSEFQSLRDEVRSYQEQVESEIERSADTVSIDQDSVHTFVARSQLVRDLDHEMALRTGGRPLVELDPTTTYFGDVAELLQLVGLTSVDEVATALVALEEEILAFVTAWIGDETAQFIEGVSLLYLCFVMIARSPDPSRFEGWFETRRDERGTDTGDRAQRIAATYRQIAANDR